MIEIYNTNESTQKGIHETNNNAEGYTGLTKRRLHIQLK